MKHTLLLATLALTLGGASWLHAAGEARPTLASWSSAYGEPARNGPAGPTSQAEPLLVYWMQVKADPLGFGPAVPGTLVANFKRGEPAEAGELVDFTFLAVAQPAEVAALEAELVKRKWVESERSVERTGGSFRELSLKAPHLTGTLAIRTRAPATGGMADGRPSPSFWLHAAMTP